MYKQLHGFSVSPLQLIHRLVLCFFLLCKSLSQMCGNTEITYLVPFLGRIRVTIHSCFMRVAIPVKIHPESDVNQNMNIWQPIYHCVVIIERWCHCNDDQQAAL